MTTGDNERDNGGKEKRTVKHNEDDIGALGPLPPTSNNLADDEQHNKGFGPLRKSMEEDEKERVG